MKRIVQAVTVLFALAMLAAYVVYSQQQQKESVAPSSKLKRIADPANWALETNRPAGAVAKPESTAVFSGSKSMSPIVKVPAPAKAASNAPAKSAPVAIAPGSKSARIFDGTQAVGIVKPAPTNPPIARPAVVPAKSKTRPASPSPAPVTKAQP